MKRLPRIHRPLTEVEHAVLWDRIVSSILYSKEIAEAFQRFNRRLRSRNVTLDSCAGGVVSCAKADEGPLIRQLIIMDMMRHKPTRSYYFEIQDDSNGTLRAWNELYGEARWWESEVIVRFRKDTLVRVRNQLAKAIGRISKVRRKRSAFEY